MFPIIIIYNFIIILFSDEFLWFHASSIVLLFFFPFQALPTQYHSDYLLNRILIHLLLVTVFCCTTAYPGFGRIVNNYVIYIVSMYYAVLVLLSTTIVFFTLDYCADKYSYFNSTPKREPSGNQNSFLFRRFVKLTSTIYIYVYV